MFDFTNKKPEPSAIWSEIQKTNFPSTDNDTILSTQQTVIWVLLSTTINFKAALAQVNKFLKGEAQFSAIEEGFLSAVSDKYGISLEVKNLYDLDTSICSAPQSMPTKPFNIFKMMFSTHNNKEGACKLLKALIGEDEEAEALFDSDIWGKWSPADIPETLTTFNAQIHSRYLFTSANFRKVFPATHAPTEEEESRQDVFIESKTDLSDYLLKKLLKEIAKGKNDYPLAENFIIKTTPEATEDASSPDTDTNGDF